MPKAGWKKMSDAEKQVIIEHFRTHYNSKKSESGISELAKRLGRSVASLGRVAKAWGLTNPHRHPYNYVTEARWIVDDKGCWLWQLARTAAGYAEVSTADGVFLVHRLNYEKVHGKIPKGAVLDHLCRVRHCVNPAHLEAVTDAINIRRGLATKLTEEDVRWVRQNFTQAAKHEMAQSLNITPQHLMKIVKNETWRNL